MIECSLPEARLASDRVTTSLFQTENMREKNGGEEMHRQVCLCVCVRLWKEGCAGELALQMISRGLG